MTSYENYPGVDADGGIGIVSRLEHKLLESKVGPHARILEVGGGKGDHVKFVSSDFTTYTVVDIFKSDKPFPDSRVKFVIGSAEELPFQNESFDRVIITCVLAHLKNPIAAIEESIRVLSPTGTLSILISNDPGFLYTLAWNLFARKSRTNWTNENPKYGHAVSHLVSGKSLKIIICNLKNIMRVRMFGFPFRIPLYNFNLSTIFHITKTGS
jgi:ubiquinone/menaquinone biosynthesis C-methylase UbiE